MRYFVSMSRGKPYALFRFNIIDEDRWYEVQGWTPSCLISEYLVKGDGDFEEITTELAIETFPDAF